eukprot:403370172
MEAIRNRLFTKIESAVLRLVSRRSSFKQWYIKHRDDALGREMIGYDKFGNKYYQYYSFHGLPTRRMVIYKFFDTNKFNIDPHFVGWLHRRDNQPPTPEELEKLYLEHDAFLERALNWDEEQIVMIEDYQRKKKQLEEKYEKEKFQLLEQGDQMFKLENWVPGTKPSSFYENGKQDNQLVEVGTSEIMEVNEIDMLERMFFEEYKMISEKDKDRNKDFNRLAYEEMKLAKYYFNYLRTQQKLQQLADDRKTGNLLKTKSVYATAADISQSVAQTPVDNVYNSQSTEEPQTESQSIENQQNLSQADTTPLTSLEHSISNLSIGQQRMKQKYINEMKLNNETMAKKDALRQQKREEHNSNRYSEFREQFDDIFVELLDKKSQYKTTQNKTSDQQSTSEMEFISGEVDDSVKESQKI